MEQSRKNEFRAKVVGNLKEGQGYADKRKRKLVNNYQKLRWKQRLQAERRQSSSNNEGEKSDISVFSRNLQKDLEDKRPIETENVSTKLAATETASPKLAATPRNIGGPLEGKSGQRDSDFKRKDESEGTKKRYKKRGGKKNAKNRFTKAQEEFSQKRKEEQMRLETFKRQNTERAEALDRYKKQKSEQHRKLNKKTQRGQPLMKYQMEVLLDKIRAQTS